MERVLTQHSHACSVALPRGASRDYCAVSPACLPVCQSRWSLGRVEKSVSGSFLPFETTKFSRPHVGATGKSWHSADFLPSSGSPWEVDGLESASGALVHIQNEDSTLLHIQNEDSKMAALPDNDFQTLSEDVAMGLILRAASGTGWTTGSGLEGPSNPFELKQGQISDDASDQHWPKLSKSPRRRMRVAFTCNVCGERTTRAINPHAYTDGTVFVQCAGCDVFHKLVDNLKLFHELKGRVFPSYGEAGFVEHEPYDFLGLEDFPIS